MNARQRRYLVVSLKSLSVLLATTFFATLTLAWFAGGPFDARRLLSPLSLSVLLLAAAVTLWLAHFVTLGDEVRLPRIDLSLLARQEDEGDRCPSIPTIFAWLLTDLKDADAHRIGSHVSACDRCRKRLALMSAVQEMSSDKGR